MMKANRREFLKQTAIAGAMPLLKGATQAGAESPGFPYVDGLSFMPGEVSTIRESGLSAFIADVSSVERLPTEDGSIRYYRSFEACARSITSARRKLRHQMDGAFLATRGGEIQAAHRKGETAVFLQFQGCEPLGEDLTRLDMFYELGLRVLQITHHNDNPFGGGALEKTPRGLTQLGIEAVEKMNSLGIVPDVSHASDATALDVIRSSKSPVILSHGAVRAIVNNARCAPDEVIRGVADSGGVVGIFMMSFWLTEDPLPSPEHLVRQIQHVARIGGIRSVGIANDFPISGQGRLAEIDNDNAEGVKSYLPWWQSIKNDGILGFDRLPEHVVIPELNNVRRMFIIQSVLEAGGFTTSEIEKIMGGNWIRVLTDSLG